MTAALIAIVLLGDSIGIGGSNHPRVDGVLDTTWCEYLVELGTADSCTNLSRFGWSTTSHLAAPVPVLPESPVVVIALGTNDVHTLTADEFEYNIFQLILQSIFWHGAREIVLLLMPVETGGAWTWPLRAEYNERQRGLCADYNVVSCVDVSDIDDAETFPIDVHPKWWWHMEVAIRIHKEMEGL